MKKVLIFLAILSLVGIFFYFTVRRERKEIKVGGRKLLVEIAKTDKEREKGLSDRKSLCQDCGMLFIFDQPGNYTFWMKGMNFDVDILWISGDQVVDITYGAKAPAKEDSTAPKTVYQSRVPADKVLEVNSGWVEKNKIFVGDKIEY